MARGCLHNFSRLNTRSWTLQRIYRENYVRIFFFCTFFALSLSLSLPLSFALLHCRFFPYSVVVFRNCCNVFFCVFAAISHPPLCPSTTSNRTNNATTYKKLVKIVWIKKISLQIDWEMRMRFCHIYSSGGGGDRNKIKDQWQKGLSSFSECTDTNA